LCDGCYKAYFKRKGANKSQEKMKRVLEEKIKSTEREILWEQSNLQRLNDKLNELNTGNINIYI